MNKWLKTCNWCWFNTFNEFYSWWEICPVCKFQDSILWMYYPFKKSCNWEKLLIDFQKEIINKIPFSDSIISINWNKYLRNKDWRPINIENFDKNNIYFPWYSFYQLDTPRPEVINDYNKAQKYNPDAKVLLNNY